MARLEGKRCRKVSLSLSSSSVGGKIMIRTADVSGGKGIKVPMSATMGVTSVNDCCWRISIVAEEVTDEYP